MRALLLVALTLALVCFGTGFALATDDGLEHSLTTPGEPGREYGNGSLTTTFVGGNGFAGNSFDITALEDLTIVGWDCNLDAGTWNIDIWTRNGTCNGFEQNPAEWTLLGTAVVVGAGPGAPTHVDVGPFAMTSGQLVGVIARCHEYSCFNYTNGGPNTYSNAEMSLTTYRGLADGWPPSSLFSYRAWNGTVHYNFGGCSPVEESTWGAIKALF